MSDILYIVIPAYNESQNIRQLINDWYPVIEKHNGNGKSRLIIINDGSKDDTYHILEEEQKNRPLLQPLTKPNGGHGDTVLFGYSYAISKNSDWIFQTDSDRQTNPNEFEAFWQKREKYDAIIGNRNHRQDGAQRKFVEHTLLRILRLVFGVKMPDSNAPFRLMRTNLVAKYIKKLPEHFNLPNVMLSTYFVYFHERVLFLPISFKPRQGGVNSINFKKIIKIGKKELEILFI